MRRTVKLLLVFCSALALVTAGCAQEDAGDAGIQPPDATATPDEPAVTGTLEASDQESDGTQLVVSSVSIDGAPGFVVVHRDAEGSPGEVIGHVAIPEGESTNVTVEFDEPIESGQYWPMLHVDAGEEGTYEFPGEDVPVTVAGDVIMTQLTLTVA